MSNTLDDLKGLLSEGRITRREFIGRASALGMAAAIPASILSEEARASSPRRGGRLRQACRGGALSDSLDGALVVDTHPENTNWQCRNNVTQMMPDGSVGPDLAESWEASPDAARWRFELHKGVEFHNGKSFEAGTSSTPSTTTGARAYRPAPRAWWRVSRTSVPRASTRWCST